MRATAATGVNMSDVVDLDMDLDGELDGEWEVDDTPVGEEEDAEGEEYEE